jgi:uncharacterized membrane protein
MAASAPMADNVASALCYAAGLLTGVLFLVLAPYNQNRTVRFHAFQSIFFHVACIILSIVFSIAFGIVVAVLRLGFLGVLSNLLWLVFFVAWLYMLISTYQGKTVVLPVIGPIAQKQA